MTVHAVRLNHAVLFVADLERSIEFYSQAFGMTVMAREPRASAAFLRLPRSGNHHDLGLFGVGAQPPRPRGSLGLYHLAWQVDTIEELEEARHTLAELGAYTGESSHGATKSVYGQDPDGNEFEVMWMLPRAQWGEFENTAPIDRLDLPSEVRRWAGVRTAAELVPLEGRALTRAFTDGTRSRVRGHRPAGQPPRDGAGPLARHRPHAEGGAHADEGHRRPPRRPARGHQGVAR
ncbi:VOC family protein [Nocardioides sp. TF02-7]|uniref:VOC family protein n=1 Tax=Nocardioides sp. TF02-7 TaxID=2917724 RepID=UPI001F06C8CC|nr:VOC family protein [Nocardioides sp. TF02-7]UMG92556.1 VOC family protein [Nocardioides sp. TF02-7]